MPKVLDTSQDVPSPTTPIDEAEAVLQEVRGLAHDVNNLLQVAMLGLQSREGLASSEVMVALTEAASLTRELFHVGSKSPTFGDEPLLLTPVVQAAVARLVPLLGDEVTVQSRFDAVDARAHVDSTTIHQAVRNLALNAHAAMGGEGHLTIELTEAPRGGESVVVLTVSDDGAGVTDEVINNLGNAQTSTRPGGSGLGLSLLKRRLASVGGELSISRNDEGGSRATVVLPKASSPGS